MLRMIEKENRFESQEKLSKTILKSIRVLVHILLFFIVLTSSFVGKLTVLFMTNTIAYFDYVYK